MSRDHNLAPFWEWYVKATKNARTENTAPSKMQGGKCENGKLGTKLGWKMQENVSVLHKNKI